jgi:tetratricopeptide (TPR) repeat protein
LVDTRGAEDIVRDSVGLLNDRLAQDAVQQLDLAIRLDPRYWTIYLQRARAWLQMQQPERARDDLLIALALHPGIGSVHALLGRTSYGLGEYDLAWHHAIRAYQDDAQVAVLLRALQEVSTAPADLQEQLQASRLFVDVGPTPDELDQGTMLEVLRVLRQAISDAPDVALTTSLSIADTGLVLEVDKVQGSPRKLEGDLVMNFAPYQEWERENLEIADLDDPASVAEGVARALEKVRNRISKLR